MQTAAPQPTGVTYFMPLGLCKAALFARILPQCSNAVHCSPEILIMRRDFSPATASLLCPNRLQRSNRASAGNAAATSLRAVQCQRPFLKTVECCIGFIWFLTDCMCLKGHLLFCSLRCACWTDWFAFLKRLRKLA